MDVDNNGYSSKKDERENEPAPGFKITSQSLIDLIAPKYGKSGSSKENNSSSNQNLNLSDLQMSKGIQNNPLAYASQGSTQGLASMAALRNPSKEFKNGT